MMALPMAAPASEPELDSALLERCRAGDPLAFRAFVVRFQGPVFALLSRVLGRGPHVDDLAQETFLKAYRGLSGFDPKGPAKLSTWLFTIATRVAIDAVRRRRVSERLFVEGLEATERSDSQATTAASPEREAELARVRRGIVSALGELPVEQRAAFVLYELHGLSLSEVGEAMSIPAATAKTRVFRARKRLEDALSAFREMT